MISAIRVSVNTAYALVAVVGMYLSGLEPAQAQDAAGTAQGTDTATTGTASSESAKPEIEEVIKTGTIASSGNFGFGPRAIEAGGTGAAPGDESSVISAGVSKKSRDECQVTVSNGSPENTYYISYRVIERNQRGTTVNSKSFSDSLKPSESNSRVVRCDPNSRMEVELRSAKKK